MRRVIIILLIVYTLLTMYVALGGPHPGFFTQVLTLLAFSFALLHGSQRMGWGRTLLLLGLTFGVSLLFESVGVATGLVYGPYHYTAKLGPMFLGLVPYLIPVAWFMMTYPALVIAERAVPATRGPWARWLAVAALGAVAMTAWDVAMDPMMVAGQHWVWETEGAYFGIPLQNFAGWWLTGFVTFALFAWLGKLPASRPAEDRFDRLAVISYAATGLTSVLIDLQSSMGGAGMAGLFAMLPWVIWGWIGRESGQQGNS